MPGVQCQFSLLIQDACTPVSQHKTERGLNLKRCPNTALLQVLILLYKIHKSAIAVPD